MKPRTVKSDSDKIISLTESKFWQKTVKIISSDLFRILIFCGAFRLYYYFFLKDSLQWDSPSYLNYHANILYGEIDYYRTPVYPYFIKFVGLFSEKHLIHNICIAQAVVSFLTIILFYRIVKNVFKTRAIINIATVFYAISPSILNFDKCIFTESLGISFMVIFLSLFINYLKQPALLKAIFLSLFSFVAIMLRPSFVILIPVLIVFWILRIIYLRSELKMAASGIVTAIFCILLLLGYSNLNFKQNGIRGISIVTNINQFEIVVLNRLYEKSNDLEIRADIKDFMTKHKDGELLAPLTNAVVRKYSNERMGNFIHQCIFSQPFLYIEKILGTVYNLQNTPLESNYVHSEKHSAMGFLAKFFIEIKVISFLFVYILFFINIIWVAVNFAKRKQKPWFNYFLLSVALAQLAVIVFGAQAEYQRLFVLAHPLLIIMFFSFIDMILYAVDKQKLLNYISV
ncbi:MAG: Dolichyl-phosphate-mannose-protein mannosyltransferase [Mucilaginibacter sp.]|nr:Dolichyl-phosphate-mannose-protein mannosyltransferase [Mucilaginibacter sp.]